MNRIGDYALIGDCHSAALVGRDGAIDWACFPRFDAPASFCAILDEDRGGSFTLNARQATGGSRAYLEDTNVLATTFATPSGTLEVLDCMPVERTDPLVPRDMHAHHSILRRARCTDGAVVASVRLAPRFEYGMFVPRFRQTGPCTAEIVGGGDALYVHATHPLEVSREAVLATWTLRAGEEAWIDATWRPSYEPKIQTLDPAGHAAEGARRLEATIGFWRDWIGCCRYDGLRPEIVRRSALALKAMTYAPSGAIVAAPTTSLPEDPGGGRNWDYRYTWIRDATLTLTSLFVLGLRAEADDFKFWLERTGAGHPEDLQIMYTVCGERRLPEVELDHLRGHRDSRPVRIGNGAVKQMQLDAYGQILEAAYLYGKAEGELTPDNWLFLSGLADIVCERWQEPDQGIWEMRDEARHFTHSKLNCWLALDRAVAIARARGLPGDAGRWAQERDRLREYLIEQSAPHGWFQQAAGHAVADASTLLAPAIGFLAPDDPIVAETVEVVRRSLERDGLVHRYLSPDGLAGGEGAFLLCSFWLLDCLTHMGRLDEARALLDRLLGLANDVGLFAEEVDTTTGEPLGNFPQAFSHMALVLSCAHLSAAERREIPAGVVDFAELALDRLLRSARP
ncbi:MAG TPA: glycoside hydrolase family 15 protein [Actinomycetota bacterium]